MSLEANKALASSWLDFPGLEEWLLRRLGAAHQSATAQKRLKIAMSRLFAPEWTIHVVYGDIGYEGFVNMTLSLLVAFPDLSFTVEDVIAEGSMVAVRHIMRGTNRGPFQGNAATGKKVGIGGATIARVCEGKFAEGWTYMDSLSLMQQLGVVERNTKPE